MKRAERARFARTSLDFWFERTGRDLLPARPARGWIRAIRDALGMTSRQLATRLDVSQSAVAQLERSEVAGSIRLDSLRRAADALGCDLVYALVPRTTLEQTVADRAASVARAEIGALDSMVEEPPRDSPARRRRAVDEYAAQLIASGRLWEEPHR